VRLVLVDHRDRVGAAQLLRGRAHGGEQVAVVEAVDQVGDDLGIGLARKDIATRLQAHAQRFVVLDDAVVHQGDMARLREIRGRRARARTGVRVRIGDGRRAVRGPARVRDAGGALQALVLDLRHQLGHARGAAGAAQATRAGAAQTGLMHRDAARVIATVFQALQALHQDGNDVARGDHADDAAHGKAPERDGPMLGAKKVHRYSNLNKN